MSAPTMKDRVVETAKEDADRVKQLTTDAAKSGAYLYPFKVPIPPFSYHPEKRKLQI